MPRRVKSRGNPRPGTRSVCVSSQGFGGSPACDLRVAVCGRVAVLRTYTHTRVASDHQSRFKQGVYSKERRSRECPRRDGAVLRGDQHQRTLQRGTHTRAARPVCETLVYCQTRRPPDTMRHSPIAPMRRSHSVAARLDQRFPRARVKRAQCRMNYSGSDSSVTREKLRQEDAYLM